MHLPALEWLDCSNTSAVAGGLSRLPPSLRELHLSHYCPLPDTADFSHLRHLRVVARVEFRTHQPFSSFSSATIASLPPSLEVLDASYERCGLYSDRGWPRDWALAHLTRLRVLNAACTNIDDAAIAALPPSLEVLNLKACYMLSSAVSFAHLTSLHTLGLHYTSIGGDTLATLPPSLVSLDLHQFQRSSTSTGTGTSPLTPSTVFPHLPVLRVLNVSRTGIGDAAIASMPASLEELSMVDCRNVTQHAHLDHLVALRVLQSVRTDLSRAVLEAFRARGCFVPVDGNLAHNDGWVVKSLILLPDGRLIGAGGGRVTLWEAAAGGSTVVAELDLCRYNMYAAALAVLHDGHRVAIGTCYGILVWDTRDAPNDTGVVIRTNIPCTSSVRALAMAHNSGHLVAGCEDGKLRVVDVDAGAVIATLAAHRKEAAGRVVALLDGRVASVRREGCKVWLWDVSTGTCASTLVGHTDMIESLAVLADGRLASGSQDNTVRLWDTSTGTCLRVLTGHTDALRALVVLPGDMLTSMSEDGTIRVWYTRDDADGAGGALARPPLVIEIFMPCVALVSLPGNRLAIGGIDGVYLWQLPPRACGL